MEEDELYKTAMLQMIELSCDVIDQCIEFANHNDYNTEWVLDMFQEQFSSVKQEFMKRKKLNWKFDPLG